MRGLSAHFRPFFAAPGGSFGGSNVRPVHTPQVPVDLAVLVQPNSQGSQYPIQRAIFAVPRKSIVDTLPLAISFRHVTPRGSAAKDPEHAVEGDSMIVPLSTTPLFGQVWLNQFPLIIRQFITRYVTPPSSVTEVQSEPTQKKAQFLTRAEQTIRQTQPRYFPCCLMTNRTA